MAADSYKKRLKGHWTQGKRYKGDGEERAYAKEEIAEFLREMDADYLTPYKKSKRRRNEKARLLHRIAWCRAALERRKGMPRTNDFFSNWIRGDLELALKLYREKYGDPDHTEK